MHRFYVPADSSKTARLLLTGREAHHALHVLRVQPGDPVVVLNGAGGVSDCEVQECRRDEVNLRLVRQRQVPPPPCRITLLQAVPRGKLMEAIIEKATELGAVQIVPLLSERVTTRLDDHGAE